MTNVDRIVAAIQVRPGATDSELRMLTGVEPHQQVNQICRRIAQQGRSIRRPRPDGLIGNYPADGVSSTAPFLAGPPTAVRAVGLALDASASDAAPLALAAARHALIVLPCSKRKSAGGSDDESRAPRVTDQLSPAVAMELTAARASNAAKAGLDERLRMPAYLRYNGHLFDAGRVAIDRSIEEHLDLVILSGGYGVLDPREPIGQYDRAFRNTDWPEGLLESALLELAQPHRQVVAFCSGTTAYGRLLRKVDWRSRGITCHLVSPDAGGRGGAQIAVPRATGQALQAYLDEALDRDWKSPGGLNITVEVLR